MAPRKWPISTNPRRGSIRGAVVRVGHPMASPHPAVRPSAVSISGRLSRDVADFLHPIPTIPDARSDRSPDPRLAGHPTGMAA